jgi:hypothetical protein
LRLLGLADLLVSSGLESEPESELKSALGGAFLVVEKDGYAYCAPVRVLE